jgi:hypothetical protein
VTLGFEQKDERIVEFGGRLFCKEDDYVKIEMEKMDF